MYPRCICYHQLFPYCSAHPPQVMKRKREDEFVRVTNDTDRTQHVYWFGPGCPASETLIPHVCSNTPLVPTWEEAHNKHSSAQRTCPGDCSVGYFKNKKTYRALKVRGRKEILLSEIDRNGTDFPVSDRKRPITPITPPATFPVDAPSQLLNDLGRSVKVLIRSNQCTRTVDGVTNVCTELFTQPIPFNFPYTCIGQCSIAIPYEHGHKILKIKDPSKVTRLSDVEKHGKIWIQVPD